MNLEVIGGNVYDFCFGYVCNIYIIYMYTRLCIYYSGLWLNNMKAADHMFLSVLQIISQHLFIKL